MVVCSCLTCFNIIFGILADALLHCTPDPALVKGKRVIELGAGTGVVGLTAAMLGSNVVLTGGNKLYLASQ